MSISDFANNLPDYAHDVKTSLEILLSEDLLTTEEKLGTLLSAAHATGYAPLVKVVEDEVASTLSHDVANAARGAAAVLGVSNTYYRFVHSATRRDEYIKLPTGLANSIVKKHGIDRKTFELFAVSVSAMNGCGLCFDSHERILIRLEVPIEQIQAAVRIGAVVKAVAKVHGALQYS